MQHTANVVVPNANNKYRPKDNHKNSLVKALSQK